MGSLCLGVLAILAIGFFDYRTGPQISGSLFYLLPVLFVTHYAGRKAGVFTGLTAAGVWFTADILDPEVHFVTAVAYWNALMRLGVFLVMVWLVSAMKALNATLEKRVRERTLQLQAEIQERMELERRILDISEREQGRIGQDLHDGLCQHLVGTTFWACQLRDRLIEIGLPEAAAAAKIADRLDESITQARNVARGLHPVPLEEQGLATALQDLVNDVNSRRDIQCQLICTSAEPEPTEAVVINLYRIAQEAVNNALKHAHPQEIIISLHIRPEGFHLSIEDDGAGINLDSPRSGGMGLNIMAYRARMIGGFFSVTRRPEGGTRVACWSGSFET